jgi:hypothetical protein
VVDVDSAADRDEVERVLASIEGRALPNAGAALAALAEASRAVSEAWSLAAERSPAGDREELLGGWLERLVALAERVMLYVPASGYRLTLDAPSRISVSLTFDGETGRRPAAR